MKKALFLAALTSLAMTSCTSDEVISSPEGAPIGFDSFIGKTTRATDAIKSNLLRMNVYGYIGGETPVKIFPGQLVSRKDATSAWEYTPLQYWTAGKDYFFTAVSSPASQGNESYSYTWSEILPDNTDTFSGTGTISFNNEAAKGNEDLVYAFATKETPATIESDPGKVEFVFKHALSRVKFTFNNAMGSDAYTIKVYELKINNAISNADLVLGTASPKWSNNDNTSITELVLRDGEGYYTPNTNLAANTASVVSGTKFIIPSEGSTLNITFKIDLIVNGSVLATYEHIGKDLPTTTFLNGYSYNFIANITPDNIDPEQDMYPILFDVDSVEGWKDATDQDYNSTVTLPDHSTTNP